MATTKKASERSALVTSGDKSRTFSMDIELPPTATVHRPNWFAARMRWLCRQSWWRSWGFLAIVLWIATLAFAWSRGLSWFACAPTIIDRTPNPRFSVAFASSARSERVTGRLLVCIAKKHAVADAFGDDQPRLLIDDSRDTQQVFAVDVWDFHADSDIRELNASHAHGYPVASLLDVPEDEYWIQAVLHPYVHYNRSDGHHLWLPSMDTFESESGVLTSPGTLFSRPELVTFRPDAEFTHTFLIDQVEPPLPPLVEDDPTKYDQEHELLQHVRFKSERLSAFWGTDVYLKAWVLLPYKFFDASTANISYPLFIYHTHYNREFEFQFERTRPDDASLSELYGYYLFANWTSDSPESAFYKKRGIIVQLQHANPYYDDSYAVNSANIGPYGDAITYEFIPYLEKRFRGIGEGWARTMYGGSTGGWESLAVQVFYPTEYNGCWSFCPDSFDFRNFQIVNLLEDPNAYYVRGDWTKKNRGSVRDYLGHIRETMEEENHHEWVMGSRGRSGGQWDAWQAVYSPVNESDGYPAAIWDKETGVIHREVVQHWEEHFDVRVKLQREWTNGLGRQLVNKLHVYVGVLDSYYLNDGVYDLDDFLKQTRDPYYNGTIEYGVHDGKGFEHCWTGSFDESLGQAWNTLNQRIVPQMVDHIVASAPTDADLGFTSY